ncbi:hypothetical protein [Streptomyces fuscichromogenes]|uniref:Uncharacterized protein n=1 Tax=Streptomyces fuscichromogenes TaxID=1324013 RepID=A0A917XQG0_9ACTN|nr:hypothetical protein [Streptomyces fuscichromogenes]GGN45402.1 hypothetical protein GCM10011578_097290 [Streptomyces fuscichromogenes]
MTSLCIWARSGPGAAEGIARAVIDFAAQFLTEDHEDVADILRQLEAVGVGQALDAHPAPAGGQPVRLSIVCGSTTVVVRTRASGTRHRRAPHRTAPPIVVRSIGIAAPHRTRATAGRDPLSHTPLTTT